MASSMQTPAEIASPALDDWRSMPEYAGPWSHLPVYAPPVYRPAPPKPMKMRIDSFDLKTPHLDMTPETAMLLRDELKRAFETLDDNFIKPKILPPEVNIHIPNQLHKPCLHAL